MRYDATSGNAIEATGLVKRFGKTAALDGVDLVARPGRVLGVLGPNGVGKTTAVRILATLLRPDGGHATVCGYDVLRDAHQVRQLIGLTGQYASVDEGLSGTNNLIVIGRLLGMPRADARTRAAELLARFDLTDAAALLPHIPYFGWYSPWTIQHVASPYASCLDSSNIKGDFRPGPDSPRRVALASRAGRRRRGAGCPDPGRLRHRRIRRAGGAEPDDSQQRGIHLRHAGAALYMSRCEN